MTGLLLMLAAAGVAPAPDIIVTGRSLGDQASDLADVTQIDRRAIERVPSRRIEDVLQQVAGVQSFRRAGSRSAHPTAGGLTMRALGGNAASRALLIVDGVPQADPFGGWVDFPAIQSDLVGRISVTRGGGSGRWGPGALAGTVEIETLAPGDGRGAAVSVRGGSRGNAELGARWLAGGERAYVLAGADFSRGDGFVPIVAGDRGAADIRAPYRQLSARLRGAVALGPEVELQAGVSGVDDARARGLRDSDNRLVGQDESLRLVGRGAWPFAFTLFAQQRSFNSQFAAADPGRATSRQTLDQHVPAHGWGARAEVAPAFGPVEMRVGADVRSGSGETRELFAFNGGRATRRRVAGGNFVTSGAFAEGSAKIGVVRFNASARVDRWRFDHGRVREVALAGGVLRDERSDPRSGLEPSGRLAVGWTANAAIAIRAAGYRGWRLPTLNELYRPFRIGADAVAANPGLKPERLVGGEMGARLMPMTDVELSLTAFAARLERAIANVPLGVGPGVFPGVGFVPAGGVYAQRQNVRAIVSRGLELDAGWRRGAFDARLSASWSRARVKAAGVAAALDGQSPAQTPALTIAASGGWNGAQGHRAGLTVRYASRQFEDDGGREPLKRALTLGGTLAWPLADRLAIEVAVENLFDARVETGIGSEGVIERAEPRTLWLGIALR